MDTYSPKVGYTLIYPLDNGSGQLTDDTRGLGYYFGSHDWFITSTLTREEAGERLGDRVLCNKEGIVVQADENRVEAVYKHDDEIYVIVFSHHNQVRDAGRTVKYHDGGNGYDMWAWDNAKDASTATENSTRLMHRAGVTVEVMPPLPVPPRFKPLALTRVFVPQARITTDSGTFEGKITFNAFGEPNGIMHGKQHIHISTVDHSSSF